MATYDMRRVGNAQGVPAMQKANTRGFDPRQFKPPTGEEEREDEEREEKEEDDGLFSRLFGGLIDLTQASRLGTQGYSPEELDQLTEEEKMAALQASEEDVITEGRVITKGFNPIGTGVYGAMSDEVVAAGGEPLDVPNISAQNIVTRNLPEEIGVPNYIQKEGFIPLRKFGENATGGANWMAERATEEGTNLFNLALPLVGTPLRAGFATFGRVADSLNFPLSGVVRGGARATGAVGGALVEPMLTEGTYAARLTKELAMINLMQATAGSTSMAIQSMGGESSGAKTLALFGGIATAIMTGTVTSKQMDDFLRKLDPSVRDQAAVAADRLAQQRRLEMARIQMEESNGVPVNVDLGPTVRPNLKDTPEITPRTEKEWEEWPWAEPSQGVRIDESTLRDEGIYDVTAAEKEIIARESGASTSVPTKVPTDRLVDPVRTGKKFRASIQSVKEESPFGWAVDVKDEEFYSNPDNLIFFDDTGTAGAAVTIDGDLVSVHKQTGSDADVNEILTQASENSITLDAFDVDGFLPNLYSRQGFKPVARVKFDREYAPEGWRPEDGEHDVVLMVRDTENVLDDVQAIPQGDLPDGRVTADYDSIRDSVPLFEDFDEAVEVQQLARARVLDVSPLPARPEPPMTREESPLPVEDIDTKEFESVMAPQGLEYDPDFMPTLTRSFDDIYRQAQIESNLARRGWLKQDVDRQFQAFSRGNYVTADGRELDWFDVPALPSGNENKWILETEYQTLLHQMDAHLAAQFARIDGIAHKNTIPFGTHPITQKPYMRSLHSFIEDGRWKQEAIYNADSNPQGFLDFNPETGDYIFRGDAGAAVLDIYKRYGEVVAGQEALEASLGIGLNKIDVRMAREREEGASPEVIRELKEAWDRGELPWLGDTIEGSGVYKGMFPRSVVKGFENVSNRGSTGRRLQFTDDGESTYGKTMAAVAQGMREAGSPMRYLEDPSVLVGIRLQAGMDTILRDWVRRYVTTPRAGLGGETLLQRARLSPRFVELESKLRADKESVKEALGVLNELKAKTLPRATRESRAAERAQRDLGVETQRRDVLEAELKNQYVAYGVRLLDDAERFINGFLLVGRPLVKGARGTKNQPVLRIAPKTAYKLQEQIKVVRDLQTSETASAADIRDALDELQFLYDRGLTIFDNELKRRPNLRQQIEELRVDPREEGVDDAWTNRQITNDVRKMEALAHEIKVIEERVIPDLLARKNKADPALIGDINRVIEEQKEVLASAKRRVVADNAMYKQTLERYAGVNQDILRRQEVVTGPDGRPLRGAPRMGPDGVMVEGELITHEVPFLRTDSAMILREFDNTGHIVDKEFGKAVENILNRDQLKEGDWGQAGKAWDNANNAIRALQASYDLSGIGIQGLAAFGLSPLDMILAQLTALRMIVNPKYKVKWYEKNKEAVELFQRDFGLHYGSTSAMGEYIVPDRFLGLAIAGEVPLPFRTKQDPTTGRKVSGRTITFPLSQKTIHISSPKDWESNYTNKAQQLLNTLGYVPAKAFSKGLNVSNMAFAEGGNMMRHQLLASLLSTKSVTDAYGTAINFGSIRGLPYKGILPQGELTPQTKKELGELINNLTGWKKGRPTVGERAALFAPRYFKAQIKSLEKFAGDPSPAGKLARRALTNLTVTMGLFTWFVNKSQGYETDFAPLTVLPSTTEEGKPIKNPNFMRMHIGDRTYKMYGTYDSLLGIGVMFGSEDLLTAGKRFLQTKASPSVDKAMVIGTGETFNGRQFNFDGFTDVRTGMAMAAYLAGESNLPFGIQGEMESQRALNNEVDPRKIINGHLLLGALGSKENPLSPNDRVLVEARRRNPEANYQSIAEVPSQLKYEIKQENPYLYAYQQGLDNEAYEAEARVGGARRQDITNAKADLYREEQLLAANVISGAIPRSQIPSQLAKLTWAYAYAMQGIQARTLTEPLKIELLSAPLKVVRRISETWDAAALPNGMVDHSHRLKLLQEIEAEVGSEMYNQAEAIMARVVEEHPPDIQDILRAKDYITRDTAYFGTTDRVFDTLFYDISALADVIAGTPAGSRDQQANRSKANALHTLIEELAGKRINSFYEFQVVARQSDNIVANMVLGAIDSKIQKVVEESKVSQKRNDQRLDESAIVYMGSKPVMTAAAREEYPNGWPQAFTTVDMAPMIREISYHPESAEKYIQLLLMTQVLNEAGMQPDDVAAGLSAEVDMYRPTRTDFEYQAR